MLSSFTNKGYFCFISSNSEFYFSCSKSARAFLVICFLSSCICLFIYFSRFCISLSFLLITFLWISISWSLASDFFLSSLRSPYSLVTSWLFTLSLSLKLDNFTLSLDTLSSKPLFLAVRSSIYRSFSCRSVLTLLRSRVMLALSFLSPFTVSSRSLIFFWLI